MTKSEIVAILSATPEDELGDMLLGLAVSYWRDADCTDEDIHFLLDEVLEESAA